MSVKKFSLVIVLILLLQLFVPIFNNITYAATTSTGLKYKIENGKVYIIGYNSKLEENVKIPSTISGKNVVEISSEAFKGNKKILTIEIPNTVIKIGDRAFKDCAKLTKVIINGSELKEIGLEAFRNCSSLSSFSMPNSVTSLGDATFRECSKLKTVKLSSALATIPVGCFLKTGLTTITIPKSITTIQKAAFLDCKALTKVTLEKESELISIGDGAFQECNLLEKMTIEGDNTSISLKLPNTVSTIGGGAFCGTNFSTVIIPNKVQVINALTFMNCKNLKKVYYYRILGAMLDEQCICFLY